MQVKVNTSQNQKPQKPNPQTQEPKTKQEPNINLANQQVMEQILQLLQQAQQMKNSNKNINSSNNSNNEFIVKSKMKASYVAIRVEQMLLLNKRITLSGLGYAIPVLLDSIMLIKKDYAKLNKNLVIENIELFEEKFGVKTVTGLRITLNLQ